MDLLAPVASKCSSIIEMIVAIFKTTFQDHPSPDFTTWTTGTSADKGVLTGKYKPSQTPPEDSRAANDKMNTFIGRLMTDEILTAAQNLKPIAEKAGLSMAQLAIAWTLREPNVSSAIIGASRPKQVTDNASASGVTLSDDTLAAIDDTLGEVVAT